MNDRLPPAAHDKISTLVDAAREGKFVIAFCPICDRTAEASDDGRGREYAAANSIAKIQLHIRKAHPPKSTRKKISAASRPRTFPPAAVNMGKRQTET